MGIKEKKYFFWILFLLILLNIIFRIPTMKNEPGSDTYVIHSLANSISINGYFNTPNILSFFGMYPGSYPSAVPFFLSGFNLVTDMKMDQVILISSIVIGLIGLFTSLTLARRIKEDGLFSIFVAFGYSLSPVFLLFTIWSASTRHLFMALLPLYIWCLLGLMERTNKKKYIILFIVFTIILGASHRLFFLVPLIIFAFISSFILKNFKISVEVYRKKINVIPLLFIGIFLIWVALQIFHMGPYEKMHIMDDYESGVFFQGKGSDILFKNMLIDYGSKIGILSIFTIIGLCLILLKHWKDNKDIFILATLLIFSPIISYGTYVPLILLIFMCLLAGFGLVRFKYLRKNYFTPAILLLSVIFSIFMLIHWNIILIDSPETANNDKIMSMSVFFKEYANGTFETNSYQYGNQIQAFSGVPILSRKIDLSENQSIIRMQSFRKWFPDFENIYVVENISTQIIDIYSNLYPKRYDDPNVVKIINKTKLNYIVLFDGYTRNTAFFISIRKDKNIIYNDGDELIAHLI